jgi:hypothetical protein
MIRLIENCDVRKLFEKGHPEALRRYWVFAAYSSPSYRFPDESEMDDESWDEYVRNFQFPEQSFIDVGKFDLAFPFFGMDEWTTVIGFVSSRDQAPAIAKFIADHATRPEIVVSRYPEIELLAFLWVDGWWEVFGDIGVASEFIRADLVFNDTPTSAFLNQDYDKTSYWNARRELQQKIEAKKH